ncbi:hypothetical protein NQ315_012029 [Exocentrus adspersus]|uniref:Uncharacterized protein n=1 Tax=Exocentrus adspersus TaxID=1586481 RepID=A0AAV8VJM9_9CUCU|nr:hypothetical protein NQ315_012029 [Exocentrus adspersus]
MWALGPRNRTKNIEDFLNKAPNNLLPIKLIQVHSYYGVTLTWVFDIYRCKSLLILFWFPVRQVLFLLVKMAAVL